MKDFYKGWRHYFFESICKITKAGERTWTYGLACWEIEGGRYTERAIDDYLKLKGLNWDWRARGLRPVELTQSGRMVTDLHTSSVFCPRWVGKTHGYCRFYGWQADGVEKFYLHRNQEGDNIETLGWRYAPDVMRRIEEMNVQRCSFGIGVTCADKDILGAKMYFWLRDLPKDFFSRANNCLGVSYEALWNRIGVEALTIVGISQNAPDDLVFYARVIGDEYRCPRSP